ncbi:type II secretion system F family protein [Candidatus Parcubacteria bacterium]|nr:type II secretion system F family protein [Candidatus Parcubacteria bacterium]
MLFKYKVIDNTGAHKEGEIEAINIDTAIVSLQNRGFVVAEITPAKRDLFGDINLFDRVSNKDIVILSRQIATLFGAQVSVLRVFRLLASESENLVLRKKLTVVADDLQGGSSISQALSKHPKIFTDFYVNMVRAGEESGKLNETFAYLADHLDRSYALTSKAKSALVYPSFVIAVFVIVMILMFTMVIPKISAILVDSGQEIPFFTKIVMGISDFLLNYGLFLMAFLLIGGFFVVRFSRTDAGKVSFSRFKISIPYIGGLYKKLYLTRIASNMNTMLISGVPIVKVIENTASVVDNAIYRDILQEAAQSVRVGKPLSEALSSSSNEIPNIMIQMIKIGEETGEMGEILDTLAKFYEREVNNAVDTLVSLIEPAMIVALALGVGILLTSVLVPIYNVSSAV